MLLCKQAISQKAVDGGFLSLHCFSRIVGIRSRSTLSGHSNKINKVSPYTLGPNIPQEEIDRNPETCPLIRSFQILLSLSPKGSYDKAGQCLTGEASPDRGD